MTRIELEAYLKEHKEIKFIDLFFTDLPHVLPKCCYLRGGKLYDFSGHVPCSPRAKIYACLEWDGHGNADKIYFDRAERTPYFRHGKPVNN